MHSLTIITVILGMFAVLAFHCWSVSALFSHRFGLLRILLWLLPLLLLPLIGPLIFVFATRRFREERRPSRKVQAAWFAAVFVIFTGISGYVSVQQFREIERGGADAAAQNELRSAVAKVEEFSQKSQRLPGNLKGTGYDGPPAGIHVTYRLTGHTMYEISAWNEKGGNEYRARSGSTEIRRERRVKQP